LNPSRPLMCTSTVDLDADIMRKLDIIYSLINLQYICKANNVVCEVYETSKGYHIYIHYPCKEYDLYKSIVLRAILKDDETRIDYDLQRWSRGMRRWVETLFRAKIGRIGKKVVKKSFERKIDINQLLARFI